MRVPLRRTGTALLVGGLALMSVAVTLLVVASSPRSSGSLAVSQPPPAHSPTASRVGLSGSSSAPPGATPGPSASGPAQASRRTVVPPAVTLTGVAALPSAKVHAGYDTPADAVDGFYQALLGGTPAQACAYATNPCPAFGSGRISGSVSIVDAVSQGNEALVETTGTICRSATCVPLNDRIVMPTGPANFGASWTSLISAVYGWAGSPLPCVRDPATGQWHVKLN
jgi:hypothetical protein